MATDDLIYKGSTRRFSAACTANAVATDPTTVTLKLKPPSGTLVTYTYALAQIIKSAIGSFYKDVEMTESGYWWWHWEGTGTVDDIDEGFIEVLEPRVT